MPSATAACGWWRSRRAEDLERAVSDKTAMMLFYNNNNTDGRIQDEAFVQLGKKHGIPTLNDAAADVPPVENLWKYTKMGFDLVAFSGGKGLRGPQSAGLLLGRKDLIAAARLNALTERQHHRARPEGEQGRDGRHAGGARALRGAGSRGASCVSSSGAPRRSGSGAAAVAGRQGRGLRPRGRQPRPHVRISWDAAAKGITAADAVKALRDGEPSIGTRSEGDALVIGVWMMQPGEDKIVAPPSARSPEALMAHATIRLTPMNRSIRFKLFLMMVLEFFIWGAWYAADLQLPAQPRLQRRRNRPGSSAAFPVAAIVGMFFSNQFADRNFAAERFLSASHLIGGVAMLSLAWTQVVLAVLRRDAGALPALRPDDLDHELDRVRADEGSRRRNSASCAWAARSGGFWRPGR